LDRLLTGIGPAHVTRADDSSRGAIIVLDHADVRFGLLKMPCVRACRGMTAMNQADPLQTESKSNSAAAGDWTKKVHKPTESITQHKKPERDGVTKRYLPAAGFKPNFVFAPHAPGENSKLASTASSSLPTQGRFFSIQSLRTAMID
jgi:hypothetical protein